jgi:O-antigen ligase
MRRRFGRDSGILLPGAAAAMAGGLLAGAAPLLAAGLAFVLILVFLPWNALFAVLSFLSITQSAKTGGGGISLNGIVIGGLTFRPAMAVVIPFAIRAYLMTNPAVKIRWKLPEYLLLGYVILLATSSILYSPQFSKSLPTVGLIAFGLLAYYAVVRAVATPERLFTAAKIFLVVILINAVYGILAAVAHFTIHTRFGISTNSDFGPGVFGLSYEHDIFASTCAVGAVAFFALWRESDRTSHIVSPRLALFGFVACSVAMLLGLARAAWLGYALAMVLLVVTTRRATRSRVRFGRAGGVLLGATLVGIVASYLFVTSPTGTADQNTCVICGIKGKISELINPNTGTGRARVNEFRTAVNDLPESPMIGLGANTFGMRHPEARGKNNYIGNVWLRSLYETGIFGLIFFAGAILLILWPNRVLTSSSGQVAAVARALSFGFVVLLVAYAGTDDTLYMWPWIMLALVRASRALANREFELQRISRLAIPEPADEAGALLGGSAAPALNGGNVAFARDAARRPSGPPGPAGPAASAGPAAAPGVRGNGASPNGAGGAGAADPWWPPSTGPG